MTTPQSENAPKLRLLVRELAEQIDTCWMLKRSGSSGALSLRLLKETASALQDLSPEDTAEYFELAIEIFGATPPHMTRSEIAPDPLPQRSVSEGAPAKRGVVSRG